MLGIIAAVLIVLWLLGFFALRFYWPHSHSVANRYRYAAAPFFQRARKRSLKCPVICDVLWL
jgi:hypothetical protein